MLRIKRLDLYMLQTFVPVFFMTFAISLFIIIMQFLWKYVEEFVGKGIETQVLAELFFYLAPTVVPQALPLAILLASLMSFGNLGESSELIAIKAAGISLLRAMRPLIVLVALISIGAFFFQNDIIPKAWVKFSTLMVSIRQKSPELEIPESTFYAGIDNYNLYVKKKDQQTGMLYDMMIYDVTKGFDNMAVIVCDSGKMRMSSNKDYLELVLYDGQDFRNFQQAGLGNRPQSYRTSKFVPYGREDFKERTVIIPFDANFNRIDESFVEGDRLTKNMAQLRFSIDSLTNIIDSLNINDRKVMTTYTYESYQANEDTGSDSLLTATPAAYDLDSVLYSISKQQLLSVYNDAVMRVESNRNDYLFRSMSKSDIQRKLRQHDVQLQRKFVLSFACLIFFFIAAPLGAIIRKGGLGMPVVISVILFIIYYIIDNVGYKMARDGVLEVWRGVWLSSYILFPLGAFITYKAINDSALFNPEAYSKFIRKIFFIKTPPRVSDEKRAAVIRRIPDLQELNLEPEFIKRLESMDSDDLRGIVQNYKQHGYDKEVQLASLSILKKRGADINTIIDQQDHDNAYFFFHAYEGSSKYTIIAYIVTVAVFGITLFASKMGAFGYILVFTMLYPVSYLRSIAYYFEAFGKANKKTTLVNIIIAILLLLIYPIMYIPAKKRLEKYIKKIQIFIYN